MQDLTIIVDSREQIPLTFRNLQSRRGTLKTADYSVMGYESVFAVERKTIQDLIGSLTAGRDRFMREMQRLQSYVFKRLLIVGKRSEIEQGHYRSMASPKAIIASIATIEARFDVPAVFASDETEAAAMVEAWAHYWTREQSKRTMEGINTPTEKERNTSDIEGTASDGTPPHAIGTWECLSAPSPINES